MLIRIGFIKRWGVKTSAIKTFLKKLGFGYCLSKKLLYICVGALELGFLKSGVSKQSYKKVCNLTSIP